jgi:hypothetical protein
MRDWPHWPQASEVMRTLQMQGTPDGIMGPLIIGCSTLHSVKEYQKLSDPLGFPTIDESDITGAESCFVFSYLKQLASEGVLPIASCASRLFSLFA